MGWELKYELTYEQQLEFLLKTKIKQLNFEVINAGAPGYTAYQGYVLLKKYLELWKPDIVTIYFGRNDYYDAKTFYREIENNFIRRADEKLRRKSKTYSLFKKLYSHFKMLNRMEAVTERELSVREAEYKNYLEVLNLANTVARVYVAENLLEKRRQASAERQFIEEQLFKLEERLRDGEERLRKFDDEVRDIKLAEPIQKQLVDLGFELATLLQKYTDKHPRVRRLKEKIEDLEEHISGFSGQDLEYAGIVREVEVNKKLYGMLKEKLEEARISEAQKVSDVSIVNPAVMPRSPVSPQREKIMLLSGLFGLIFGVIFAFVFETMDTSIGTIDDVENLIKLPVLGIIPSYTGRQKKESNFLKTFKNRILREKKSDIEEAYVRLIVHHELRSPIAEACRNIRTNLRLNQNQKLILVTSAEPREGKTTIMTNLGLTAAQKGAKTLLVSSDLRRPALAKTFGIERVPGLNEVITGRIKLEEALRNVSDIMMGNMHLDEIIKSPGMGNIWILPSGHLPFNPAEILESQELPSLIEELRNKFDVVFLDSPPILPVTDASLLASYVDTVVLCYEIGRTSREALGRAKTQLESVGAKISGVILNHISPQTEMWSSYPYYKYRYYAEEEPKKTP